MNTRPPSRRSWQSLAAVLALCGGIALPAASANAAEAAKDAEASTHGNKAATPQVAFEQSRGDFFIRQYELGCLSQLSYLIGSGSEAAVVDPQRDVDHYIRDAAARGVRITAVLLTHTNADFVAGHTELAKRVGAKVYISGKSDSAFSYRAMQDRDELKLGGVRIAFWSTPGHTLDSMTLLVHVPTAKTSPAYALTGDTLFIGGIGRPDLVGGAITPSVLGSHSFDSIQRLKTLPDETLVLPAHGAGSLCGAHLSDDTTSTIGAERASNPYLKITARAAFVAKVVSGLPVAPQYFKFNVAMNRQGPPVVAWNQATPKATSPQKLAKAVKRGAWVLDLRDQKRYAAGHIAGSINVAVRGRLDTWTGIVVPFEEDLYLVGSDAEVREATFRLRRIGYDRIAGFLKGGVEAWRSAGQRVRTSKLIDADALQRLMQRGEEPMIVDVRTENEFAAKRLGNYANIPVDQYHRLGRTLDKSKPVVLMCNSAYRSSMAVGLAEREGFTDIGSLAGGLHAWEDAGRPVMEGDGLAPHPAPAASPVGPLMRLPEVIPASALAAGLMDAPQTYALIDIRPSWQFAEYHVPGAVNVPPSGVSAHIESLPEGRRVVVLDRAGAMGFAVAGAVLQSLKNKATVVRVLAGGTAAYFQHAELGDHPSGAPILPGETPHQASGSAHAAPPAAAAAIGVKPALKPAPRPAAPRARKKRRSAGC